MSDVSRDARRRSVSRRGGDGKQIVGGHSDHPGPQSRTILDEAASATSSDRPSVYGHPSVHFAATAAFATAYLQRRGLLKEGAQLLPEDWPMLMVLDKVARQAGSLAGTGALHRDTLVDTAGYPRTAEMLEEERARRGGAA
jgi:hypothetical protein